MPVNFNQFVDLRLFDVTPAQIYFDAQEVARAVIPDFDLRQGTLEDALFQGMAYMSALNIGALNRLPNSLMMGVANILGAPADEGSRATVDIEITAMTTDGASIPAGTLFAFQVTINDDVLSYTYSTDSLLTIDPVDPEDPLPSGTVSATCLTLGVVPSLVSGDELVVLSSTPDIYSATCGGNFSNGTNEETTDEFLNRFVRYMAGLSAAKATAPQLENYLSSAYPETIKRVKIYDLTDSDGLLEVDEADSPGYVTIFAYGPNRMLTSSEKTTITTDVVNKTIAGINIGIVDPPLLDFVVTAELLYDNAYESTDIEQSAITSIVEQFSTLNVQYIEEKLRYNDVLLALINTQGVRHVASLSVQTEKIGAITDAVASGGDVTYTSSGHNLIVGDIVDVSGISPSSLDSSSLAVTARTTSTFTVENPSASGSYVSGGNYSVTYDGWGTAAGDDLTYSHKGSLVNISPDNIFLTMTEFDV